MQNGLVEPFNDVIEAIGADDYYEGANEVFKAPADGNYVEPALVIQPPTCFGCARI